jgi:tetratricopeptide (TPR) repeat protein
LLLARADSLIEVGKIDDAMKDCDAALALDPKSAIAVATRALAMYQGGKLREAFDEATKASKLDANIALPYLIQGWIYDEKNFPAEAIKFFEKALAIDPVLAPARNSMAWVLATTSSEKHYNPKSALEYARNACEWDAYRSPQFLDTLAVVYAANGDFANAAKTAQVALDHALANEKPGIQSHLELFKKKKAYRAQKK